MVEPIWDKDKCMHEVFGYPPSSKRHWRLVEDKYGWTCTCKEGRKARFDFTVLTAEELAGGLDSCSHCGKKLVKAKERTYFIVCNWCGKELSI